MTARTAHRLTTVPRQLAMQLPETCSHLAARHLWELICLNMGTGTLEEALAWVEYCNSARDTYWAGRRRGNGHLEPHGVHWWGLGNEIYGEWQVGALSAREYVAEGHRGPPRPLVHARHG